MNESFTHQERRPKFSAVLALVLRIQAWEKEQALLRKQATALQMRGKVKGQGRTKAVKA